jgi:LmbE family N-acetylglucosaminyl deacetylase
VHRQVFLGYHDSGMAGEPTNHRPGAFAAAGVAEAAAVLAAVLTEELADVLVTYDEHGGYGHPDHIQAHRVGMAAAELAGTPVVYLATMNRDLMTSLAEAAAAEDLGLADGGPEPGGPDGMADMGEPCTRLTTEVDVTPWLERKRAAMRAHASQITETSLFLSLPDGPFALAFGREWFIRVRPPAPTDHDGPFEAVLTTAGALR